MNISEIETSMVCKRIRLRPLQASDDTAMYDIYHDAETMKYWSDPPAKNLEGAQKFLNADLEYGKSGKAIFWAVELVESGQVIGKATLIDYHEKNRRAEIGYIFNRKFWRKGLAQEAITAVVEFAFEKMNLHRIEADVDDGNIASIGLLEKLGFQREGFFRDRWHVYGEWQNSVMLGLLKPDWQASKNKN